MQGGSELLGTGFAGALEANRIKKNGCPTSELEITPPEPT
jgi:hypothetical protein